MDEAELWRLLHSLATASASVARQLKVSLVIEVGGDRIVLAPGEPRNV